MLLVRQYRPPPAAAQGAQRHPEPRLRSPRCQLSLHHDGGSYVLGNGLPLACRAEEGGRDQSQAQQRSEAIEKLLSEANKPADKPEEAAPVREIIPAK